MPTKKFVKGEPRHPKAGRKKGTPNKFTTLKQAYLNAFQNKKIGGEEGLVDIFSQNDFRKMDFFKMMSKMLPSNIDVEHSGKIDHTVFIMPRPKKKKKDES